MRDPIGNRLRRVATGVQHVVLVERVVAAHAEQADRGVSRFGVADGGDDGAAGVGHTHQRLCVVLLRHIVVPAQNQR